MDGIIVIATKQATLVSLIPYVTDISEQSTQWCRASSGEVMQVYSTKGVQFCLLNHYKRISQSRATDYPQGLIIQKATVSIQCKKNEETPLNDQQTFSEAF